MSNGSDAHWAERVELLFFRIQPRLPLIDGIFDLGANTLIASHSPHKHIQEHLHDHLYHMHIRYGFEIPAQTFEGISAAALEVAMLVKAEHRVRLQSGICCPRPRSTRSMS